MYSKNWGISILAQGLKFTKLRSVRVTVALADRQT